MADSTGAAPTEDQLGAALINAHNAGDEDAARTLAGAIINMRAAKAASPSAPAPGSSPANPLDDVAHAAGAGTIARASLAPDPQVQIKRYAESFGQPESDFGIVGDHIVRRMPDNSGQYARVEPSIRGATGPIDAAERAFDWVSGGAGQAIPATTGTLGAIGGAIAGIPTGPGAIATGVVGGAAGAAAGEVMRQKLDHALAPDSDQTKMDWGNVGWQAAGGGAAPLIGAAGSKIAGRIAPGLADMAANELPEAAVAERSALLSGTAPVDTAKQSTLGLSPDAVKSILDHIASDPDLINQRINAARDLFNVDNLSLGQATGSKVAQAAERQSARLVPFTQDFANRAIEQNKVTTPGAVNMMLDDIAPNKPASDQIANFRSGAGEVVNNAWDALRAEAQPAYASALDDKDPYINEKLQSLLMRPTMKAAWGEAQKNAADEGRVLPQLYKADANGNLTLDTGVVPDWRAWQDIKKGLGNIADMNQTQDGNFLPDGARALKLKSDMMGELYKANPDWQAADAKYGSDRDITDAVMTGGAGIINRMSGADRQNMVNSIFTPGQKIMPDTIPDLRQKFADAGRLDDWNGAVRNYLASGFDQASKSVGSSPDQMNVAMKMYNGFWGNPQQNEVITNALGGPTSPVAQRWNRLGDTLEMLSHRLPEGSPTATDMGAPTLKSQGGVFSAVKSLLGGPKAAADNLITGLNEMQKAGNAQKFAEYTLNSDDGMALLKKLSTVPPDSPQARSIVSDILTGAGVVGAIDTAGNSGRPR